MANIVVPQVSLLLRAAATKVEALDGGSLRLFKNDITPGRASLLADFVLADFSGYASKTVATWGDPYVDPSAAVVSLAPLETFSCTGAGVANIIYGAFYLDVGGALSWAARFDTPVNMALVTDALPFVPRYVFSNPLA